MIGRLLADADCQMADTDYRPIIGAPLFVMAVKEWLLCCC